MLSSMFLAFVSLSQAAAASGTPTGVVDTSLLPPTGLWSRSCGNDVDLHWNDVSSAETGFVILRRDLPAAAFQEVAVVAAGVTTYLDSGVASGAHVYAVATRGLFQGQTRTSPPSERKRVHLPGSAPVITTDLPSDLSNDFSDAFTFHVTATDPDGDRVSLRLQNPQYGMVFEPVIDMPSPATLEVRWRRDGDYRAQELPVRLVFESDCAARLEHDVRPARVGNGGPPFLSADVTGDGTLDALAVGGSWNPLGPATSVFVFAGAPTPSGAHVARLLAPGDDLVPAEHGLQCADVDLDGTLDVFARGNLGTIHVWKGGAGLVGTPAPSASLQGGSGPFDLVDLDGDGVLDVVQSASSLTVGGNASAGSLFVWFGAGGYAGVRAPDRVLTAPVPAVNDALGSQTLYADVTGDGELELLATARQAVFVWDSLELSAGSLAPHAVLTPGSSNLSLREIRVVDLSADGVLDVLRGNHLWQGGPVLSGAVSASATLAGQPGVELTTVATADLNGDGNLDALLTGPLDFDGAFDTGGFYLWAGAGPSGSVTPSATLRVPGAASFDNLTSARLVDLDDDGILDVLAYSIYVEGPVTDAGAMFVWYGGVGLSGLRAQDARLGLVDASTGSLLTSYGVHLGDLDHDGRLDVAAAAPWYGPGRVHIYRSPGRFAGDLGSTVSLGYASGTVPRIEELADVTGDGVLDLAVGTSLGRILVWRGGPGLLGATTPDAVLTGSPQLGLYDFGCPDVDRDGIRDILYGDPLKDGTVVDAGAIEFWKGGAGLSGTRSANVTLTVPGARSNDRLANDGLRFGDWTGDGILDLIAITPDADASNTVNDSGALYLWNGATLTTGGQAIPLLAPLSYNALGRR